MVLNQNLGGTSPSYPLVPTPAIGKIKVLYRVLYDRHKHSNLHGDRSHRDLASMIKFFYIIPISYIPRNYNK